MKRELTYNKWVKYIHDNQLNKYKVKYTQKPAEKSGAMLLDELKEQEYIMRDNQIIAEFMGVNVITLDDVRKNKNPYFSSADGYLEDNLKYHTSWDWLTPVAHKCYELGAEGECIGDITMHLTEGDISGTYKAVVEFIEAKSVEADTKAVDEAFYLGFCHALEYVKREIESVDEVEIEVEEDSGNLTISGTINIDLGQHLDAGNMIDDIMRKYERDTTKDGSNV